MMTVDLCTGEPDCTRQTEQHADLQETERNEHAETRPHITAEFDAQEPWMIHIFYDYLLPSLMEMANDMTVVAMHQMLMIGKFFDAKQQMETTRVLQEMQARARRDYEPSLGVCTFGTTTRSLASSEERIHATRAILSQWAVDRHAGNTDVSGSDGEALDRRNRLEQFRRRYCFQPDNNEALDALCSSSAPSVTVNKDVDYAGTVEYSPTLNVDFTDARLTQDEQDIIALASNLYGHRVPIRIPETFFDDQRNHAKVANIRAVIAKRSVAEASFFNIVGLRSMGDKETDPTTGNSEDTGRYMRVIMKSLGYETPDINLFLCGKPEGVSRTFYMTDSPPECRPSYFAQMEVLTKKIYQDPVFYTNTYDTPANIERKKVSMQAIGLMQDFDTLQSYLRTEMMLSVILETEIMKLQETVANRIQKLRPEGTSR